MFFLHDCSKSRVNEMVTDHLKGWNFFSKKPHILVILCENIEKFWSANLTRVEPLWGPISQNGLKKAENSQNRPYNPKFSPFKTFILRLFMFFKEECLGIWCVSSSVTKQITGSGDQPFFSVVAIPLLWLATFSYLGLVPRSRATDEEYDPLLVEAVNPSNLPILRESRQERLLPPHYNGKSRHHHRETVTTLEKNHQKNIVDGSLER